MTGRVGTAHLLVMYSNLPSGSARPTKTERTKRYCWSLVICPWSFNNPRQMTKDQRRLLLAEHRHFAAVVSNKFDTICQIKC